MGRSIAKAGATGSSATDRGWLEKFQITLGNLALNSGALAIKTSSSAVAKTANTVTFIIDGKLYQKAAGDMPALTGLGAIAAGSFNVVAFTVNAAGTLTAHGGTAATTLAGVTLPSLPDDEACIGFVIVNAVGATFTGGTTALDAGSHVVTYVNTPFPFNLGEQTLS